MYSVSFDPWGIAALVMFIGISFMLRVYKEKNLELKKENDKLKEALEYFQKKYND
ncbi:MULTISPECIES: hypothetical protein [Paraliobacillus]|uniref:hypothetical protein n=1 Tax=Paraliobacillus TaxID=200903 RepID=UPI0013002665|nr:MULTISPECIES: hypothetical protein [Paraliobacillus]